jgi:hypothetical protein
LFSHNLENILKLKRPYLSSLGLRFLGNIRKAPPFLDIQFQNPLISLQAEQVLTEYFRAKEYVEFVSVSTRGGESYTVKYGDTLDSIAEKIYGDSKFTKQLDERNYGAPLRPGMVLILPYIDLENTGQSPSYIEKQFDRAKGTNELMNLLDEIKNTHGLMDEEVLLLLKMAYDVARLTVNGIKTK